MTMPGRPARSEAIGDQRRVSPCNEIIFLRRRNRPETPSLYHVARVQTGVCEATYV
jgi:hypothetical protein